MSLEDRLKFTDLPPEAMSWPTIEAAGRWIDGFDWRLSHRLHFEQVAGFPPLTPAGYWIVEVYARGVRMGWLRRYIVREGQPVFLDGEGKRL